MRLATKFVLVLALLSAALGPSKVYAGDEVQHLYGSYFLGRLAGFSSDNSTEIAVGNQMIDMGFLTNPVGLFVARKAYHFMGFPIDFDVKTSMMRRGLALASINHPLFYKHLDDALRKQDKIALGRALHALIDTWHHSGWSSVFGHGEGGKAPDRNSAEIEKAWRCMQSILEIMVMIRRISNTPADTEMLSKVLGETLALNENKGITKALYRSAHVPPGNSEELLAVVANRPDLIIEVMKGNPKVVSSLFPDIETTPEYVKFGMTEILELLNKKSYVQMTKSEAKEFIAQFDDVTARRDLDTVATLRIVVYRVLQQMDPELKDLFVAAHRQALVRAGFNSETAAHDSELSPEGRYKGLETFKLHGILGLQTKEGLQSQIDQHTAQNESQLNLLSSKIKKLLKMLSVEETVSDKGESFRRKVSIKGTEHWTVLEKELAIEVLTEAEGWRRVLDSVSHVEQANIGEPVSTEVDLAGLIRELVITKGRGLKRLSKKVKSIAQDPTLRRLNARYKALAMTAWEISHETTKDTITGPLNQFRHARFEDEGLSHTRIAAEARRLFMKNIIADFDGVNFQDRVTSLAGYWELGPKFRAALHRLGLNKKKMAAMQAAAEEEQRVLQEASRRVLEAANLALPRTSDLVGSEDTSPREFAIDDPGLRVIKAGLNGKGFGHWFVETLKVLGPILMLPVTSLKNRLWIKYIAQGSEAKERVTIYMAQEIYGDGIETQRPPSQTSLGEKYKLKPLTEWAGSNQVQSNPAVGMKCNAIL